MRPVVFVFLIVQILVPLRLHLYEGDVKWTEYGHKFSWRMKLRTKRVCDVSFGCTFH